MSLVVLCVVPILGFTTKMNMKFMQGLEMKGDPSQDKVSVLCGESLTNIRTVHAFTSETAVLDQLEALLGDEVEYGKRTAQKAALGYGLSQLAVFLVYALSFWYGGKLIEDGEMSVSDMMVVLFALVMTFMSLGHVSQYLADVGSAALARDRIFHLLGPEGAVRTGSRTEAPNSTEIRFSKVSFSYPTHHEVPVLTDFDLKIRDGHTVAFVGSSGCGKSTLMQLLLRFYHVDSGSISIGGVDIEEFSGDALRDLIGVVGQEPDLFDTTIEENMRYGNPLASIEDIYEAARRANIHDMVLDMPDGYQTVVGPRGAKLSGGQRQRVAIARALVRRPRILLLGKLFVCCDICDL